MSQLVLVLASHPFRDEMVAGTAAGGLQVIAPFQARPKENVGLTE